MFYLKRVIRDSHGTLVSPFFSPFYGTISIVNISFWLSCLSVCLSICSTSPASSNWCEREFSGWFLVTRESIKKKLYYSVENFWRQWGREEEEGFFPSSSFKWEQCYGRGFLVPIPKWKIKVQYVLHTYTVVVQYIPNLVAISWEIWAMILILICGLVLG